ncbi:LysR family transcriptional regulator [Sinorhizobium meliloti]|uniref:LysR family transcriptional regulator n=1 Tax=Rhizobium meliloti TaxID=382 RepID=UPI000FDB7250|nr:LysR family transcriptional regulator [Sinorhizobium meliloti]MDW9636427.1 LysR family transcriptional regulator [Sinorhizobium meliloti]MDW9808240.1 LysR family transcriptional regulator [Sinorhizobium meliloti]MDX0124818.1 LysR family transcriptional regulator [Sinorhizobium meliloti]MDX0330059.1 LysR family transcriptional regulator [Sinorhizobium meliloti]MQW59211.1 LysR family transcriptional regulator [Sinorhizobium meliloti]
MDLSVVDCFVKVADARSISAASRLHRLPKSTLSHRIRQLEDQFGVELFVREGHQLHLTDAGSELLRHARKIRASCDDAVTAMAEMHKEVAGTLRVGSTGEFGTTVTSELLYAFQMKYPQIILDVVFLSARQPFTDVSDMALDGIFHWGEPSDVDYVSRRLATASYGLYASPEYLAQHDQPASEDELARHRGLIFRSTTRLQPWYLSRPGGPETEILLTAALTANDYWTLKYFAVAGQGIAYLPGFFVETECQSGLLVPVLPEWRSREMAINLVYSRRRHVSRRFKAFVSFCMEFYRRRERDQIPRYFVEKIAREKL